MRARHSPTPSGTPIRDSESIGLRSTLLRQAAPLRRAALDLDPDAWRRAVKVIGSPTDVRYVLAMFDDELPAQALEFARRMLAKTEASK